MTANIGYYVERVRTIYIPLLTTLLVWLSSDTQIVSIRCCDLHNTI
jgi:hypothetical protein